MLIDRIRDLTLIDIDSEKTMVIACDSCGSIGMKENDNLKVPPYYTGKFAVRVPLFEVLSSGAQVITVTDAVCNEMNPTGNYIISGIKEELREANINNIVLTGSTEENIPTTATAVGVTVIGIANKKKLKVNNIKSGDILVSIGIPKVGHEIKLENDIEIASYKDIKKLLNTKGVMEIIPVGSKGIVYEANEAAKNNRLSISFFHDINIDIHKTAGPATVILAAINKDSLNELENINNLNKIGVFEKN
jgi:selenophosphate synthetase-related protein